jgi:hypothetical protein
MRVYPSHVYVFMTLKISLCLEMKLPLVLDLFAPIFFESMQYTCTPYPLLP